MDYYKRTRVGFHFELPYPADKVTFDTDQMGWVDQTPGYQPKLTTETINGVKTQVYTCYRLLEPTSNSPTVNPGTSAIQLAVKVKAAPHGYKFRPTVQAWTAWNKNNPTDTGTHKAMSDTPKDVTVSAKLNLNISLQYQITGGGTYDFNTGDATAPNKGKGKIQGRQLHVLVRTAMRWKDRSKGLKGIEVPTGSIGYKLNVSSVFQDDDDKHAKHAGEKQWQPILWDRIHQTTTYKWNGKSTHNRKCDSFDHNGSFPSSITVDKESVNDGTTVYDDGTITDKGTTVNVSFTGYDTLNYPCANAGQYTSFGKCSTAYMDGSLTQQQVAALHVDEFTFILPTATTDGKTAAQYYGKDQTGNVTITDTALSATSVSGMTLDTSDTNTNQSVADDDLASGNWTVRLPGAFIQSMYYTNASTRTVGRCDNATTGRWQDAERYKGSDRVLENTKFGIVTAAENKLNSMGVEAVLDERDDGMPEFHFGEFGGGLEYDKKGFRFTIWAGEKDNVFETVFYKEFRHELIRRLANQYERKAEDVRDGWKKLSGDDTPMPDNLVKRADGYSSQAEKLRDAIQNDDVPMLLSEEDFNTLSHHRPLMIVQPEELSKRLQGMGLLKRKYWMDDLYDELTDEGRAAVGYTSRVKNLALPSDFRR